MKRGLDTHLLDGRLCAVTRRTEVDTASSEELGSDESKKSNKKKRVKRLGDSERYRRSDIRRTLYGLAYDAVAASDTRTRPPGEIKPDPPNQDFGYEAVGATNASRTRTSVCVLLGEAASFQRWHLDDKSASGSEAKSPTADARSFKRLLDPRVETTATAKSLYLFGAACWTLGARYASGPLALCIAGLHPEAVQIIAGAKSYAISYDVADELSRCSADLPELSNHCIFDHWIERLGIVGRPVTYEAVLKAADEDEPRDWGEPPNVREPFLGSMFNIWNEREAKRSAIRLSPLAMLCLKQSYLNIYHGRDAWERSREHELLIAAKQQAEQDKLRNRSTPLSYAILSDYLREAENIPLYVGGPNPNFGVDPQEPEDEFEEPF